MGCRFSLFPAQPFSVWCQWQFLVSVMTMYQWPWHQETPETFQVSPCSLLRHPPLTSYNHHQQPPPLSLETSQFHAALSTVSSEHKLSYRAPKKAVHEVKMTRFIMRGWNLLVGVIFDTRSFPGMWVWQPNCGWHMRGSPAWQGWPGAGDQAIITVTNIAAGQNISITKHISDLGSQECAPGQARLMAHCYHSEERHHSPGSLLKWHKQWELNVTMSP